MWRWMLVGRKAGEGGGGGGGRGSGSWLHCVGFRGVGSGRTVEKWKSTLRGYILYVRVEIVLFAIQGTVAFTVLGIGKIVDS